jgi:adenylate cyclase
MAKEIELKFLCNDWVNHTVALQKKGVPLLQGYLHVDKDQQIRVRLSGLNKAHICVKHMIGDGVERDEFEYKIPYTDAKKLYDKCKFKFRKTRYTDKTKEGFHIDIDVYENGLITAEVELPERNTYFTKPGYFGKNVTGVHEYCNYHFAGIPESAY